jgi:hypothetical protein
MATKAWATQQQKAVEEIFFQNEAVSLCLLVNRRARIMRVIDFRAGPTAAKRLFVISLAQREGVDKVCTLVERDEVATWVKLGFTKEGNIPGFYKRSDAFLLGAMVPRPTAARLAGVSTRSTPPEKPRAKVLRGAVTRADARKSQVQAADSGQSQGMTPAQERAERTVLHARKLAKETPERAVAPSKVASISESDARRAVAAAARSRRALTAFEPFGRDVERRYFVATSRGGFELCASIESQGCFGNAYLELLQSPKTDVEKAGTTGALAALCEKLLADGVVSCFSLTPSDDVPLATAFAYSGFRRTGLLCAHLVLGNERKDAILWSRKLANPSVE